MKNNEHLRAKMASQMKSYLKCLICLSGYISVFPHNVEILAAHKRHALQSTDVVFPNVIARREAKSIVSVLQAPLVLATNEHIPIPALYTLCIIVVMLPNLSGCCSCTCCQSCSNNIA